MAVIFDNSIWLILRLRYKSMFVAETSFGSYDLEKNGLLLKQYEICFELLNIKTNSSLHFTSLFFFSKYYKQYHQLFC